MFDTECVSNTLLVEQSVKDCEVFSLCSSCLCTAVHTAQAWVWTHFCVSSGVQVSALHCTAASNFDQRKLLLLCGFLFLFLLNLHRGKLRLQQLISSTWSWSKVAIFTCSTFQSVHHLCVPLCSTVPHHHYLSLLSACVSSHSCPKNLT